MPLYQAINLHSLKSLRSYRSYLMKKNCYNYKRTNNYTTSRSNSMRNNLKKKSLRNNYGMN
jgi:hypothetical protein